MEKFVDGPRADIFNFEIKLREKLTQLQSKEDVLAEIQRKLSKNEKLSCKLRTLLENKRRNLNQVRSELKTATELIVQLEDEKIHNEIERTRLEISYQNTQISENNLKVQTKRARMQHISLQRQNELLEASLMEQKMLNQVMTGSVEDLWKEMNLLTSTVEKYAYLNACPPEFNFFIADIMIPIIVSSNVGKLKCEQDFIRNTFRTFAEFNREARNGTKDDSYFIQLWKLPGNQI